MRPAGASDPDLPVARAPIEFELPRAGSVGTGSRVGEKEASMSKQKHTSSTGQERSVIFRLAMIGTALGLLLAVAI